ncbi:MAG: hypothetical protein JO346_13480 [Alphaproteobacteria bacterium]|nr:hypothetical protein [Alphaproteobacteria bacterium]
MKSLIAAAALTVGMFALGTSAADARPYHHGHGWDRHHHRHCVSWGWHHRHMRVCRRWGW